MYNVRDEQIESLLRDIGRNIGDRMPKGWGFTLQIFSYGEGGSNFYISSANRDDMIKMFKEFIKREEH
jgi:hypothetical protein